MASYSCAHLATTALPVVVKQLRAWLGAQHGAVTLEVSPAAGPVPRKLEKVASEFAIAVLGSDVVSVWFSAYDEDRGHEAWLLGLTRTLHCRAAVVLLQSVSSYGYVAIYERGKRLRLLEGGGDDGLTRNEGAPFEFEAEFFDAEDDEPPEYLHDLDMMEDYCSQAGVDFTGEISSPVTTLRAR